MALSAHSPVDDRGTSVPVLTAASLDGPGARHGFFTRQGGVSGGIYASLNAGPGSADEAGAVAENHRRVAQTLLVPGASVVTMHQTHSADVLAVSEPPTARPTVDALVTATPGLIIAALAADCGPVLFRDVNAGVVAAAHSGWRGAFTGILECTIATMERLGARRDTISAAIGPTIGPESYEVGPEFVTRFTDADRVNDRFFRPSVRAGHAMFDLPAYIAARLEAAGVAVEDLAADTYADEARYFSYRRATHRGEPDYGRLISAIVIVD